MNKTADIDSFRKIQQSPALPSQPHHLQGSMGTAGKKENFYAFSRINVITKNSLAHKFAITNRRYSEAQPAALDKNRAEKSVTGEDAPDSSDVDEVELRLVLHQRQPRVHAPDKGVAPKHFPERCKGCRRCSTLHIPHAR
jgi:hypothetical protein